MTTRGENANDFDPRRFIKKDDPAGGIVPRNQIPPMAFPVWGIAPHVCPARFYAGTGVLVLVALLILRLDFLPVGEGRGDPEWRKLGDGFDFSGISRPTTPVQVSVKPRAERMGRWRVVVGTPNTRLQFSVA